MLSMGTDFKICQTDSILGTYYDMREQIMYSVGTDYNLWEQIVIYKNIF